jgi:hypothetical protein
MSRQQYKRSNDGALGTMMRLDLFVPDFAIEAIMLQKGVSATQARAELKAAIEAQLSLSFLEITERGRVVAHDGCDEPDSYEGNTVVRWDDGTTVPTC